MRSSCLSKHDQLKLRPYFLPWVSKNRRYDQRYNHYFQLFLLKFYFFFYFKFDFSLLKNEIWKKNKVTG